MSFVVFAAVVLLSRIKLELDLGFDVHVFAKINAVINTIVSFLLLVGLLAVLQGKYRLHKKVMITAIIFSTLFLVSYICHHLLSGDTKYGGEGAYPLCLFLHTDHPYLSGSNNTSIYSVHFIQGIDSRMARRTESLQRSPGRFGFMYLLPG